jgi:hypothetical protein
MKTRIVKQGDYFYVEYREWFFWHRITHPCYGHELKHSNFESAKRTEARWIKDYEQDTAPSVVCK